MPFVKLDCGILDSTLWVDREAREIFITALLMADPVTFDEPVPEIELATTDFTGWSAPPGNYGFVHAASLGICNRAGVNVDVGLAALFRLSQPEPESRSRDFEGRRLIRVDGGFLVLNFARYREKDHTAAERAKRYRERQKKRHAVTTRSNAVTPRSVTQAEAEAEADKEGLNQKAWDLYMAHRTDIHAKPLTEIGRRTAIARWCRSGLEAQQRAVDDSISNGYTGCWPDKHENRGKKSYAQKLAEDMDAANK